MASVFTVRTIARSSTIFARCGNNSLTQAPDLSVPTEFEYRRSDGQPLLARRHRRDPLPHPHRVRQIRVEQLVQLRLVVKSLDCDGAPFIEDRSPAWRWRGMCGRPKSR